MKGYFVGSSAAVSRRNAECERSIGGAQRHRDTRGTGSSQVRWDYVWLGINVDGEWMDGWMGSLAS